MSSKFNVGDKVRLLDKYRSVGKSDFIKGEPLIIEKIEQRVRKKTYILKFHNNPKPNQFYHEFAFELCQEPEDWATVDEEKKKLFIREVIGAMYLDKKLYSAIKNLINQSNTQKTQTQ